MPRILVLATLFAVLSMMGLSRAAEVEKPPNVLMIIGDDQGWTDYGFMGSKVVRTPHIDKLASQGLVFKRGYVPSSLCRPSLATIITGLFPHQHKIMTNDPPYPRGVSPAQRNKSEKYLADCAAMVAQFEALPNLAKLLGAKGFVSHQSGKWWEGDACRCGGFTVAMTHGDQARGGRHGDEGLKIGRQGLQPVFDFLDKAKEDGKPFYAWYAPMMPHAPHNPPERLLKKYTGRTKSLHVAKYWAMCEWFDETVGELLAKLEANRQAENTLVVYLHDNGWIQDPTQGVYAPKSKQSPYDGGLRTPIIIRWPLKVKPATSQALAHSIDLAPTILAAVGSRPTSAMQGLNLLDTVAMAKRDTLYGEVFRHTAVDLAKPAANLRYRWVIQGNWKLIVPYGTNTPGGNLELYDLEKDPHETENLAAQHAEKAAELTEKVDRWWKP
jgi:arylsulfatase A-like enzyme